MNRLLLYLLESGVGLLVFYLLYAWLLKRETCFQYNRFYLLATLTVAFILPWLELPWLMPASPVTQLVTEQLAPVAVAAPVPVVAPVPATFFPTVPAITTPAPAPFVFPWVLVLGWVYALGSGFLMIRLLRQLHKIHLLSRQTAGTHFRWQGILVSIVDDRQPTFAFGNRIFLNDAALSLAEQERILRHEAVHVRQKHTGDVLYLELIKIGCWFNPLIYLYQRALTSTHEYIADAAVLQTTDPTAYARLVVKQLFPQLEFSLGNHFNQSLTLKRVKMMQHPHRRPPRWKQLLALAVLGVLTITLSSGNAPLPAAKEPRRITTWASAIEASDVKQEKFSEPLFPGGKKAMYEFITKNIKYPAEAIHAAGWSITLPIVIDEKGILEAPKYTPRDKSIAYFGPNAAFDEEIYRVLNAMPRNWTPATIQGKPVVSQYLFTFSFSQLNSETQEPATAEYEEYELDLNHQPMVISKTIQVIVHDQNIQESSKPDQPTIGFNNPRTILKTAAVTPGSVQSISSLAFDHKIQFPLFPGGRRKMNEYLRENIRFARYVDFIGSNAAGASVTVEIKVDEKGQIATEDSSTDDLFVREIKQAIRRMPPWQPAEVDGQPTAATYDLTFFFKRDINGYQEGSVKEELDHYTNGALKINAVLYGERPYTLPNQPNEPVLTRVETKPEFPGGMGKMYEFINQNLQYPAAARAARLEGMVSVKFIVTKAGKILESRVDGHLSPETDAEILRVVGLMPTWTPAKQADKPVNAEYTLPYKFRLHPNPPKPAPQNPRPDTVYKEVEQMPQFPGGIEKMYRFLGTNIHYPTSRFKTEGTVIAAFIVTDQGKITDLKIEQSVSPAVDAETLRVIKMMPDWEPGKQGGQPVNVAYKLPVRFKQQ